MMWYKALKKKFRSGNLFSRILRVGFEKHFVRPLLGVQLFAGVFLIGPLASTLDNDVEFSYQGVGISEVVLNQNTPTNPQVASIKTMQNPTKEFIGVSTLFRSGHPGYDLRAPLGSAVYPVMGGIVKSIIHSSHGYGRHIWISHENGFESLYAHMGLISVEEGQIVDKTTKIGEVGLTGWTTGPHVHFELYHEGVPVNPGNYIDLDVLPIQQ